MYKRIQIALILVLIGLTTLQMNSIGVQGYPENNVNVISPTVSPIYIDDDSFEIVTDNGGNDGVPLRIAFNLNNDHIGYDTGTKSTYSFTWPRGLYGYSYGLNTVSIKTLKCYPHSPGNYKILGGPVYVQFYFYDKIEIITPEDNLWTKASSIPIQVLHSTAPTYIADEVKYYVDGVYQTSCCSSSGGIFEESVSLHYGTNTIVVEALINDNVFSTDSITIYRYEDINILFPSPNVSSGNGEINVVTDTANGAANHVRFYVNGDYAGRTYHISNGLFWLYVDLEEGTNAIEVVAYAADGTAISSDETTCHCSPGPVRIPLP
jgi:hypothetical protein